MHRVFKTRHFARWMRKSGLTDPTLCTALTEMPEGLIDAVGDGTLLEICHEH